MNDMRERLIELLMNREVFNDADGKADAKCLADNLLANGVTVHEWISVEDRLPETGGYVVCIAKRNPFSRFMPMVARIEKNGWANPTTEQYISEVTHWMPLPQPPEGE